MRYRRCIKILFIVLLPILILTLSLPYIDTNELKAEETIIDDSPYGEKIIDITSGAEGGTIYALNEKGEVYAWGLNDRGQLGNGTTSYEPETKRYKKVLNSPTINDGNYYLSNVKQIFAGGKRYGDYPTNCGGGVFALLENGQLYAWGDNQCGSLGLPSRTTYTKPTKVPIDLEVESISIGYSASVLLTKDGKVYTTGSEIYSEYNGVLGLGSTNATITSFTEVTQDSLGNPLPKMKQAVMGRYMGLLSENGNFYGTANIPGTGSFTLKTRPTIGKIYDAQSNSSVILDDLSQILQADMQVNVAVKDKYGKIYLSYNPDPIDTSKRAFFQPMEDWSEVKKGTGFPIYNNMIDMQLNIGNNMFLGEGNLIYRIEKFETSFPDIPKKSGFNVQLYTMNDIPAGYNNSLKVLRSGMGYVLSKNGALYENGIKLDFGEVIIKGQKKDNSAYITGEKYNDKISLNVSSNTTEIKDIVLNVYDQVSGSNNLNQVANSGYEISVNENNHIKKKYEFYVKGKEEQTKVDFIVDLYKKDISVTGIENNKSYNSATISWDENNGIADNPISVTMTKDGSEYSYTKGAELNEQGSYTLTATDTYGNTKTYAFSILGPDDSLGLTFTKTSSGTLEYDNAITKANAQIGTVSLVYGEDASTPGTIDLTSTSISAGNDDGYFSIDGDKLNVEKDLPAGTYTLTIDGTDSNGTSFSHTVEIVIAQKNVTLSLSVSEMTYGETVTIGTDQVVGLPAGFTPSITLKSDIESMGSYENDEFTPDKAGTAVFTISVTDPDGNYTFTGGDQNVVVKQKSVTLSLTQPITKYPGESLAKISPAASDNYTVTPELINGDTLNGTATYAYVSGSDQTSSGEKIKVKITGLSNDNYAITEATTELTVLDGDEIGDSWYTITGTKKTGFDWYSSDVSIAIDTSKSGKYDLISKDGDFTGATSSFVLNSDDTHDLSIQMKDSTSGRLTKPKDETIKIDRVIPIFTIDGNVGNQTVTSGVETKGPVVLSSSLTSANASTVSYYYTTSSADASSSPIDDTSKWTLLTDGKLTASQEGTTTYYIKAVSGAGLISNVQEFTTVINNDVTTPSNVTWTDGLSEQDLIYGDSLSLQISGLQNEEVSYSILDGAASSVTLNTNTRTLTANSGTGTIKVQAKIKGYKEPLIKTITLKKKDITVKTQVSNKDTISVDLNASLPQTSDFSITSSDLVGSDTISIISSVTYEYRNAKGDVITPTTNIKGTYKLYANITTTLDNYTIKTIVPAIVDVGGDITYSNLTVKVESLKNGAYVPYQEGTWANKEIRFTLQGGIQDTNKITGYEYIISSTKPEMDDPNWTSISNGGTMIHTVTQNSIDATYWFRVTPCAEGAKLSKQTTINLDHVSPNTPIVVIKEKPRNALEKALNAISFNAWFQQEVEVSFTSLDSDSGVKEITYEERTDTGTTSHTIPYGTSLTYDKDTALYLKAKAVDQAGNESTFSVEQPLAIDMSAPVIKGVQNQKEYKQYYVPRYVTVTDSSNGSQSASGLKQATYEKDNSPAGAFVDNVGKQIKGEGVYKIYALDEAGNEVTLTFKIVKLPDIETEIDGSDESKEIIDQIIKELEEVKDHIDQNEKDNYDKWIEDATDKWNDLRTKVVEDKETTSKVEGQGDTTFDPKTELIVEEIPKDQVPVLPKYAIKTYDVYLMKGNDPVQPDGSVKVYLPYEESEPPIVYEISENGSIKQLSVKQEEGYVTFVTTVLKKYAISNTAQSDTSGGNEPTPDDPSKNDQQCVVGPDGKLETADDVCAGGNGDHPPVKEPDGSITVPEGGVIIFPDKEVPAPDGAIINPDGSVDFPDGTHFDPDGNETTKPDPKPDPNPNPDDGKGDDKPDPNPDDKNDQICTTGPDGVSGTGDDVCGTPNEDGDKPNINPDGSVTVPDGGSVIFPDGSEVELPDGGIIKPDGSVVLPDGTEYDPDGSKKEPEKPKRECNIKGTKINVDSDHDGLPDLNLDLDNDCVADINIDMDNDNIPDLNIDTTGDGNADINIDSNTDGIADVNVKKLATWTPDFNTKVNGFAYDTMTKLKADLNIDVDGDGKPDVNIDSDGDGIADTNVIGGQSQGNKTDIVGGSNTADSTKWYIWLFMMLLTISTMIYSIYRKKRYS